MKARVTTTGLKLRKGPSMSAGLVDELAEGDIVEILQRPHTDASLRGGWCKVRVTFARASFQAGEEGYVWGTDLELLPEVIPGRPPDVMPPIVEVDPEDFTNRERETRVPYFVTVAAIVAAVLAAAIFLVWFFM